MSKPVPHRKACSHVDFETARTVLLVNDGVETEYCVYCIWRETERVKPIEIKISQISTHPDRIRWGETYARDAINRPGSKHHNRIMQSDLNYPINVLSRSDGDYTILDGCHRIAKAYYVKGVNYINAKVMDPSVLKDKCVWYGE